MVKSKLESAGLDLVIKMDGDEGPLRVRIGFVVCHCRIQCRS